MIAECAFAIKEDNGFERVGEVVGSMASGIQRKEVVSGGEEEEEEEDASVERRHDGQEGGDNSRASPKKPFEPKRSERRCRFVTTPCSYARLRRGFGMNE